MFVYCIYLEDYEYYGSTVNLNRRQAIHNTRLKQNILQNNLYKKARELGIEQINLVVIHEGEDYKDVENQLILEAGNNCLNMQTVKLDRERSLRLHREAQRRYIIKKNSQI